MVHQRESPRAVTSFNRKDRAAASSPVHSTSSATVQRGRLNSGNSRSPTASTISPRSATQVSSKASLISPRNKTTNVPNLRTSQCGGRGSNTGTISTNRHCSPQRSACGAKAEAVLPRMHARVAIANGAQGSVRYVGQTQFKPGLWVGVELDEPLGKGDGSVQGHVYFRCAPLHGIFVMPSTLQILETCATMSRDASASSGCYPKQLVAHTSQEIQIQHDKPTADGTYDSKNCSRNQREPSALQEDISTIFHTDISMRSSTCSNQHAEAFSTQLSPKHGEDDCLEEVEALQDMYGADWCNPSLYSSQKKKNRENDMEKVHLASTPEKEMEISDIAERLSFSGDHRKMDPAAEIDMADEHRLLYVAMEGLRVAAESAIARAETAEARLAAQREASAQDAKHQSTEFQKYLAEEVKGIIKTEVKQAVQAAVNEATAELRVAVAEARQLRDAVKPSADMISDFHAALAMTQGNKLERCKLDMHSKENRDPEAEFEGRETVMMMAMKAIAGQVLENGSNNPHISANFNIDDTHSLTTVAGASATQSLYSSMSCSSRASSPSHAEDANDLCEVTCSARLVPAPEDNLFGSPQSLKEAPQPMTPTVVREPIAREQTTSSDYQIILNPENIVESEIACTPQRASSVPGLLVDALQPQESRRVRDVVSQFEKILPGSGRHQPEALAPWPFKPVTRSKNFSAAATPWTTALTPTTRRPPRTASLSALR